MPLLTRFYSPEDFSILALYVAILTIAAPVTCMRLDTAIPLPESDDEAANLLALALSSTIVVIVLLGLVVLFFGTALTTAVGRPEIAPHLWLVPFGVGLMGFYSSFQYTVMRQKAFTLIARTKVMQALAGLSSQIGLAWAGYVPLGLLLGHALMSGAGVVTLALRIFRQSAGEGALTAVSWYRMLQALNTYRRFPQYSVAGDLSNNAGIQLPILLIAAFITGPEAGLLFLAMRAVGTPMTIVGGAIAQVYYSYAADYARQGTLADETTKIFKRLSRMLVVPMLALCLFAPDLFRIAFGPEWERAGIIVIMMMPWYAFRLISSPISMVMHVQMRQRLMLMLTLAGLVIRVLPLLLVLSITPEHAIMVFAITSALFYAAILTVFLAVAGISIQTLICLMIKEMVIWISVVAIVFTIIKVTGYA